MLIARSRANGTPAPHPEGPRALTGPVKLRRDPREQGVVVHVTIGNALRRLNAMNSAVMGRIHDSLAELSADDSSAPSS